MFRNQLLFQAKPNKLEFLITQIIVPIHPVPQIRGDQTQILPKRVSLRIIIRILWVNKTFLPPIDGDALLKDGWVSFHLLVSQIKLWTQTPLGERELVVLFL